MKLVLIHTLIMMALLLNDILITLRHYVAPHHSPLSCSNKVGVSDKIITIILNLRFTLIGSIMYPIRISLAFILLALLALLLTPMTLLRPRHRNNMGDVSQICGRFMLWYWGADVKIEHPERLEPNSPCVIIANHQDTHDVFFAVNIIKRGTVTLGKWEMLYVPFIGGLFYLAGNIVIKRTNKAKAQKALSIAAKKMKEDQLSVLIFPEGTRNWGKPLPFKLGAFKLAIEAQVPIQPVCFSLRHITMDYKKWCSGTVNVKCLEPIPTEGLTQDDAAPLASHCQNLIEQECIEISQ